MKKVPFWRQVAKHRWPGWRDHHTCSYSCPQNWYNNHHHHPHWHTAQASEPYSPGSINPQPPLPQAQRAPSLQPQHQSTLGSKAPMKLLSSFEVGRWDTLSQLHTLLMCNFGELVATECRFGRCSNLIIAPDGSSCSRSNTKLSSGLNWRDNGKGSIQASFGSSSWWLTPKSRSTQCLLFQPRSQSSQIMS